jgi:hypothetical protein
VGTLLVATAILLGERVVRDVFLSLATCALFAVLLENTLKNN